MKKWLKCQISDGMFSDESTIIVRVRGNGSVEYFVPRERVRQERDQGYVQVDVLEREDGAWVELPTNYRRSVAVDEGQLVDL